MIKLVSWNVNGLRAVIKNNFFESFYQINADVFAIQETKIQQSQLSDEMKYPKTGGYESFWSDSVVKKGYSGVGVYSKLKPKSVRYGIGIEKYDQEGRIIEMDFGDFIFFNIYFPNGQMSPERLQYKLDFYRDFFQYLDDYKNAGRNIIITGDFNTAHNPIDLKNPKSNEKNSGFLKIERDWMDKIIENGYVDTFRRMYPDTVRYSWWSYRFKVRDRNIGWRIDYFFVTQNLWHRIKDAVIYTDIYGSDHCPVGLFIE